MLKPAMTAIFATVLVAGAASQSSQAPAAPHATSAADTVTVYRVATCGCCTKWIAHLKEAGFTVTDHVIENRDDAPPRPRVPADLRSCHTATLGRYVIEGHVPADVIKDLMRKQPDVEGIAVPGMPAGSPGMESPNPVPYDVIAFDKSGQKTVFARK